MAFKFEKLTVWQKALDLSHEIHEMTRVFPKEELFVLSSQVRRAADSVVLNIAEGSTSQSNSEYKQFLKYALRSVVEVVACLHLAKRRRLLDSERFSYFYEKSEEIARMIQGLKRSLN